MPSESVGKNVEAALMKNSIPLPAQETIIPAGVCTAPAQGKKQSALPPMMGFSLPAALLLMLALMPGMAVGESCAELLRGRCETCHYLTRVCEKVEKDQERGSWFGNTSGSWKRTIKNMIRQGAKLNGDEEALLVDCLSTPEAEVLDLCKR